MSDQPEHLKTPEPPPPQGRDFARVRKVFTAHRWAQVLLALSLMLMLNYVAAHFYHREDLTSSRRYTLAPETRQHLSELKEKVSIYVLMPESSENGSAEKIRGDLENLLREYTHASMRRGEQYLSVEFVALYRQRSRAQEIISRFNLTQDKVSIVVASGERYREVMGTDLYVIEDGLPKAFRGEAVFTEAILQVASARAPVVYFLSGHGEMRPNDTNPANGLSQFSLFLQQRNILQKSLDLSAGNPVPEDADLLILAAPRRPLQPREEDRLREYLSEAHGRMLVLLRPGAPAGLDELFYEWGILADNMAIVGTGQDFRAEGGDLIVRHFADHPITHFLTQNQLPVIMGLTQPVRPDPGAATDERLDTLPLLSSAPPAQQGAPLSSWAKPFWSLQGERAFNPSTDLAGPVPIAVLSERRVGSGLGLNIPGGKLLVFGNADFAANNYFQSLGNSVLLNNAVNWCLERNTQLNIAPRPLRTYKLTLSRADMHAIALRLGIIPLLIGFIGVVVIWKRRH